MSVGEICNRNAVIIGKSDSIYRAAALMREQRVNYLVVVESNLGNNIPIGALTEHEIVVDIVAERLNLDEITIGDVMQPRLLLANEHDNVIQTVKRMRHNSVRCIPVVDAKKALIGVLSIDDILDRLAELLNDIGHILTWQQTHSQGEIFGRSELR